MQHCSVSQQLGIAFKKELFGKIHFNSFIGFQTSAFSMKGSSKYPSLFFGLIHSLVIIMLDTVKYAFHPETPTGNPMQHTPAKPKCNVNGN